MGAKGELFESVESLEVSAAFTSPEIETTAADVMPICYRTSSNGHRSQTRKTIAPSFNPKERSVDVKSIDSFSDPDVQRCPYPLIEKMHQDAPVFLDPVTGFYVVVGFADIAHVNQRTDLFSNQTSIILGVGAETPEIKELYGTEGFPRMHTLVTNDPPSHTMYRAIVDKVFTTSFVRTLEPYFRDLADDLIDGFASKGAADLLRDYCNRLPVYVIADQLGAGREHWEDFKKWSDTVIEMINPKLSEEERLTLCKKHVEMQKFIEKMRVVYSAKPQEGTLLSRLAHAEVDGRLLTPTEFNNIAEIMIVAGNETTASTFAHCFVELVRNQPLREKLEADHSLIPNFIEEMLRLHAPSPHFYREVLDDTELSGVPIPKGSIVMLSYLAGNYDPEKFPDPREIDLDRKPIRNHLGFGRGIHFCVGHQLARAELRIGIERLLDRLKDLRFDPEFPEPALAALFHIHTVDQLMVRFTPEDVRD